MTATGVRLRSSGRRKIARHMKVNESLALGEAVVSIDHETAGRPEYSASVKDLPAADRPRERLAQHGADKLSTQELLAILLSTGTRGEPVLDMAQHLLQEFGGLFGLARMSVAELQRRKGLGFAKAATLKAALELAGRLNIETNSPALPTIHSAADVDRLLKWSMATLPQEQFRVLILDMKNRVLRNQLLYSGSLNSSPIRIAEVFKPAVLQNAASIIAVHNHPSGDPTPSEDDIRTTEDIRRAGELLDVQLLDHIIIGRHGYASLKERRLGFP